LISRSSPATGEGGNHGCQGDFGKEYVVRLSGEERERLETLIRKGKSPAREKPKQQWAEEYFERARHRRPR
jgi:hypothetical protein